MESLQLLDFEFKIDERVELAVRETAPREQRMEQLILQHEWLVLLAFLYHA